MVDAHFAPGPGLGANKGQPCASHAIASALLAISLIAPASPVVAGSELADTTEAGADRTGPTDILLDYGSNPIPPEVFESPDYVPPPGYLKNTPRTAEFNAEETLSSPGEPDGVVTIVTTSDGYTWKIIASTRSANWPYDPADYPTFEPPPTSAWDAAFRAPTPPEGVVRYSANEKNQIMTYWATEQDAPDGDPILRFFVLDPWGNRYMMMATGAETAEETRVAFEAAVLPARWSKSTGNLPQTIDLAPAYGAGDQAQFNIWRDSADNTFVQIGWSKSGNGIAQQIVGMPIWGGPRSDRINGTDGDDLIHGAQGNDVIAPLAGNDEIYGDAGTDVVVLSGKSADYTLTRPSSDPATFELDGPAGEKLLHDVELVRFDDRTCRPSGDRLCANVALRRLPILRHRG